MRLITHILRKIDDDKTLVEQLTHSPAIAEMISSYNAIALVARNAEDDRFGIATGEMYGEDFKKCLSYLPAADLHKLLDRYLAHFPHHETGNATRERINGETEPAEPNHEDGVVGNESASEREERQLKHWLIKAAIIFVVGFLLIVVGAGVAILTHNHMGDNAVFKSIMVTAAELIKILASNK